MMTAHAHKLAVYAQPAVRDGRGGFLARCLGASLLVFCGLGLLLWTVDLPAVVQRPARIAHRIAFQASAPAPEITAPPEIAVPEITPETVVAQPVERPVLRAVRPEPVVKASEAAAAEAETPEITPRRVYGVRKVMARGLGGGGTASSGLVVKRGNVLDGVADTLTATAADLQGELAALSTVERAPEPIHQVKPRYSEALTAARASGTVTARLLVDTDGSVADLRVIEDIGHDSATIAAHAFARFRFRPALRHGEPVAVWIVFRMRFEFQE